MRNFTLFAVLVVMVLTTASSAMSAAREGATSTQQQERWIYLKSTSEYEIYDQPRATEPHTNLCATVYYNETRNITGWDGIRVVGYPQTCPSDELQAYAGGLGEGLFAAETTLQAYDNLYTPSYVLPKNVSDWMKNNTEWMDHQIETYRDTDPFWYHVDLISNHQFNGLLFGINYALKEASGTRRQMTSTMLLLMQQQGDQMTLGNALTSSSGSMNTEVEKWMNKAPGHRNDPSAYAQWFGQRTHCSSLVGLAPENKDLFIGHATWGMYTMMMRVFKTYSFDFVSPKAGSTPGQTVTFSSYPGVMVSIDDYYTTSAGLAITETSFSTFNKALYKYVVPSTVLYWLRAAVANRLSDNGETWTRTFGRYNSGTYNAQWNVVDFKLFTPGEDLPRGTFWISEQIPGYYWREDKTLTLASGQVWGSFNLPSNRTLFELSGTKAMEKAQGKAMNSWQLNVRANIWRRDGYKTTLAGLSAFKHEMQYNNYKHDPLSQGQPTYAIAARGDLGPGAACWGAIDAKVTSYGLFASANMNNNSLKLAAPPSYVYNGPTPQQGNFQFSTSNVMGCTQTPPPGLVNTFNFSWAYVQ